MLPRPIAPFKSCSLTLVLVPHSQHISFPLFCLHRSFAPSIPYFLTIFPCLMSTLPISLAPSFPPVSFLPLSRILCIHTYTYIRMHVDIYIYTYIYMCMYIHSYMYVYIYIYVYICICMYTCIHLWVYSYT